MPSGGWREARASAARVPARARRLHTLGGRSDERTTAVHGSGEGSVEAWKFVALFLVIWLPLWAYFEMLVKLEDESDR